jgi:hypothetical protein
MCRAARTSIELALWALLVSGCNRSDEGEPAREEETTGGPDECAAYQIEEYTSDLWLLSDVESGLRQENCGDYGAWVRTTAEECLFGDAGRQFLTCSEPYPQECAVDDDCHAGDGQCDGYDHGSGCFCEYECRVDGDCAPGHVCLCAASPGSSALVPTTTCLPANCRTNADCSEGLPCTLSRGECYGVTGLYCRTPDDLCTPGGSECDDLGAPCLYSVEAGRWECGMNIQCE